MNTLAVTCEDVLKANDKGTHTIPSPGLYPHQWLWDSCFSAIGWAHIDPQRAKQELLSLKHGQWHNGMIPHMIFSQEVKYSKDRKYWRSWMADDSPENVSTSGITQPPLLAEATQRVGKALSQKERIAFYKQMVPVIYDYHQWIYAERDPHQEGLALQIHPYETGLDNTPPWINQLREHNRPMWIGAIERLKLDKLVNALRRDTKTVPSDQRMNIIEALIVWSAVLRLRRKNYDIDKILHRSLFAIEDVAFNSIFIRNNQILIELAKEIKFTLSKSFIDSTKLSQEALEELWDEAYNVYFSRDFVTNKLIREPTVASLLPLYAGTIDEKRANMLTKIMMTSSAFWLKYPVPSVPKNNRNFREKNYWSGPTWLNTNWLIIDGLKRHGMDKEASALTSHTLKMVKDNGVWEYYNPKTGEGLGSSDFSWTAALTLDLLNNS